MPITTTELQPPSWKQLFAEFWWLYPKYKNKTAFIVDGSIRTGKTMWMSLALFNLLWISSMNTTL